MTHLQSLGPRSIILTSGTLSPLQSFKTEIGIPIHHELENTHIVMDDQVYVGILTHGFNGTEITSSFAARKNVAMWEGFGRFMLNVCKVVRGSGLLIFLPSYALLNNLKDSWKASSTKPGIGGPTAPATTTTANGNMMGRGGGYGSGGGGYGSGGSMRYGHGGGYGGQQNNGNDVGTNGYATGSIMNEICNHVIPFFESKDAGATDLSFVLNKKKNENDLKAEQLAQQQLLDPNGPTTDSNSQFGRNNHRQRLGPGVKQQDQPKQRMFGVAGSNANNKQMGTLAGYGVTFTTTSKTKDRHYMSRMDPSEQAEYRENRMNFLETIAEFRSTVELAQRAIAKHKLDSAAVPRLTNNSHSSSLLSNSTPNSELVNKIKADPNTRGAMLFGIARGKASEGIDFADAHGRVVAVMGLPLASWLDPQTILKQDICTTIRNRQENESKTLGMANACFITKFNRSPFSSDGMTPRASPSRLTVFKAVL